jgi:peptide-methionine (S)-S-oxide reductase
MSTVIPNTEVATFASGCFWGVEHIFQKHYRDKGVVSTSVGFIGGKEDSKPNYRAVCGGDTGHAEAVRVVFDPEKVSYAELVEFFYRTHDPTTLNRQGADRGSQYRSAIFTHSPVQYDLAKEVTAKVQAEHFTPKDQTIVTEIAEAGEWYEAENYHQNYLERNPYGYQCPTHRLHW